MKRSVTRVMVVLVMALVLVMGMGGCGKADNSDETARKDVEEIKQENQTDVTEDIIDDEVAAADESAVEEIATKKTQYPITITTYDADGSEIMTTYEKAPKRVLAVYQGSIETLLALGLESHAVAFAGLDNEVPDEQKEAFSKVEYLDEFTPSKETVTMLETDMIFSWGSLFSEKNLGVGQGWQEKGANPYINTNTRPNTDSEKHPRTLENEYRDLLNIGQIFDVQDKAEAIVADMQAIIDETVAKTADRQERPTVLMLEYLSDTYSNYGAMTLGGDMITKLGGELVNPDGSDMGKEDIVALNPEVIFVVYMPYGGDDAEQVKKDSVDRVMNDEALASLDAVNNERVIPIMLSEVYASATRTKDGIQIIAEGMYLDAN